MNAWMLSVMRAVEPWHNWVSHTDWRGVAMIEPLPDVDDDWWGHGGVSVADDATGGTRGEPT